MPEDRANGSEWDDHAEEKPSDAPPSDPANPDPEEDADAGERIQEDDIRSIEPKKLGELLDWAFTEDSAEAPPHPSHSPDEPSNGDETDQSDRDTPNQ